MWPDNTDASRGLQQCLESMLEYNLEQKNLDACRACLADLPENKSVWRERVDALAKEIEEDQQDLERLKKMEDDLDLHTASSARSLLMLLFGIIWTGTSLYGALRYGGEQTSNADQLRSHMHSGLRNFAIAAGGLFAFRKRVFANVANARLAYLLLAFTATLAMIRWSTWYLEEHILTSRLAENGLAILLLIAIGLVSDLRICLFALIYVVLGAATLLWPEYYPFSRPVAIALTFGGFAWLWSPSQLDKKISL